MTVPGTESSDGASETLTGSPQTVAVPAGRALAVPVIVALMVIVADQVTKMVTVAWLGPDAAYHRWELAGAWLAFDYVENTGAAFGILRGRTWLLSAAALGVATWFAFAYGRSLPRSRVLQVAIGLVLGGAIGNLIDRVRLGYVVDFVAVGIWPRFNVADSAITIGLVLLFLHIALEETDGSSDA